MPALPMVRNVFLILIALQIGHVDSSEEVNPEVNQEFVYHVHDAGGNKAWLPAYCAEGAKEEETLKAQKLEMDIYLPKAKDLACRREVDESAKPPKWCPIDDDGNRIQCWGDHPNYADPDWRAKSRCRDVQEHCTEESTVELFICYESDFNVQKPYKPQFTLVNESPNAVHQMCEAKREELNEKQQGNVYNKYWHGIAVRVCVTRNKTMLGIGKKDEYLVVRGNISTSYSDTIIPMPTRMERIGTVRASTRKEWYHLMTTELPPLLRITWAFDGKTVSMQYKDANGTQIDASTVELEGLQLQRGVNALEDSGLQAVMFDMSKFHLLFTNNSAGLYAKIGGTVYNVKEYISPKKARQEAEHKELAIRDKKIGCWMMREANELEKNNCITTITQLNYTEKCVPLYPGNDVINGIGEATDTLNDARQTCGCRLINTTRDKRQVVERALEGNSGHWLYPIGYAVEDEVGLMEVVREGIALVEAVTCITFFNDQDLMHYDNVDNIKFFLEYRTDGDEDLCGTASQYGAADDSVIWIRCKDKGTVAHEIGHALGLKNEHNRSDRDKYVWLDVNVCGEASEAENFGTPYDFYSIMHHPLGECGGMKAKLRAYDRTMGNNEELSFKDAKILNKLYCDKKCPEKLPCASGGYTDPKNCTVCRCPEGYGGIYCDRFVRPDKSCGDKLTADLTPFSIEYGGESKLFATINEACYWRITTEQTHQRISITLQELWGFDHCPKICDEAYLEIKLERDKTASGPRICCDDQLPYTFTTDNDTDVQLILRRTSHSQGFKLVYDTLDSPIADLPPPNDYKNSFCTVYKDADDCRNAIHPEGDINKISAKEHTWNMHYFSCPRVKVDGRRCELGYGDLTVNAKYRVLPVNGSASIRLDCCEKEGTRFWIWKRGENDLVRVDDLKCGTVTH